jgi:hypothetical protein
MPKCPYCGDYVKDVEKHLRRSFRKRKKRMKPQYKTNGKWIDIRKD